MTARFHLSTKNATRNADAQPPKSRVQPQARAPDRTRPLKGAHLFALTGCARERGLLHFLVRLIREFLTGLPSTFGFIKAFAGPIRQERSKLHLPCVDRF